MEAPVSLVDPLNASIQRRARGNHGGLLARPSDARSRLQPSSWSSPGALNLVIEAIDNALDVHLAGSCSRLFVSLGHDHFCVVDDGPGLPTSEVVAAATVHHNKRVRDGHRVHAHVIGTGMGLAVLNALSQRLELEVRREGQVRRWVFEGAILVSEAEVIGACEDSGMSVRAWPDPTLLAEPLPSRPELAAVLENVHWLCPSLRVELNGRRFSGESGLPAWVRRQAEWDGSPVQSLSLATPELGARVELAWSWLDEPCVARQAAFVNLREAPKGSHIDGALTALATAHGVSMATAKRHALAIVSIVMERPTYDSPTREVFAQPDVEDWLTTEILAQIPRLRG